MYRPAKAMSRLLSLMGALLLAPTAPALAQGVITNTASARWTEADRLQQTSSNTVAITVSPLDVSMETLRFIPDDSGTVALKSPRCGGETIIAASANEPIALDGMLEASSELRIGETLFVRISLPAANLSSDAIDQLDVVLTSSAGDEEIVTIFETGPNTGVFLAAVPTSAVPPQPTGGDCRLSVREGDRIQVRIDESSYHIAAAPVGTVRVLADPFGLVFDSNDASPVDGATITLVDSATGAPAQVFADDGFTAWPSTVITGQAVTDGSGRVHPMPRGEYRFPLAALGSYRLVVVPPAPYAAPSTAPPASLAGLLRPDALPVQVSDASYGRAFALSSPAPVRVDIPVDRAATPVTVIKTASRASANPGDAVFFTVVATNPDRQRVLRHVVLTDTPSPWLRFARNSVRIDGLRNDPAISFSDSGSKLTVALGSLAPGQSVKITYAMTIRPDAPAGEAANRAEISDDRGGIATAGVAVRIEDEVIASRMTLIGRIAAGDCRAGRGAPGLAGVRVTLEDGSFAITDADGRYHFEGLVPGTHVVQAASETLPQGGRFVDCARSARSAGSAASRFVTGGGGSLAVADFVARIPLNSGAASQPSGQQEVASDRAAAGAETDWLALGDGPTDFLFPAVDHNPRAPAVRVVIRHRKGETVDLKIDGKPVDPVAFDGARFAPAGYAVSIWRGIPLHDGTTRVTAAVKGADGTVSAQLERKIHFSSTPARIVMIPEKSRLIADGTTRPVIAFRVLDRAGLPVHAGLTGEFTLSQPYESAAQVDAMQVRALSGLDRAAPTWTVRGDDGVAFVELAPTMVSGPLKVDFVFKDESVKRRQTLETWIIPGAQKWTVVGLAETMAGSRTIADHMERTGRFNSDLGRKARVALYAKGRVLGRFLLTAAYDSAKQKDQQRLLGAIDPKAYYTVFADGSNRRFDAASRERLYVRIETRAFYALYGDFATGFDQTELARYQRNMTGVSSEGTFGKLHVKAFAAKSGDVHRHDEIQGGGISGPYRLSNRAIVANSETVKIEVRDRFRSEVIVETTTLSRFIDYDIDMMSGTITFRRPILSRDVDLNPQFIVVDYDVATDGEGKVNAGLRADVTLARGLVRLGTTALTDTSANEGRRSDIFSLDLRARLTAQTELRGEAAASRSAGDASQAWLVEIEHHDGALDLLGYVRSADRDFGLGQLNGAERGRRKVGLDGRYKLGDSFSLVASAWHDDSLVDATRRSALELGAVWRSQTTEARLGMTTMQDRLQDGSKAGSTTIDAGVTRHLLDNRLELSGTTSLALGKADSVDLPSRYRAGLAYAITRAVKLVGTYEVARGKAAKADTARAGLEVAPWDGARILGTMGQQSISEYGKRTFAAFGLNQSLPVSKTLTLDATLDSSRTLGGIDAGRLVNALHPAASGGNLGEAGTIAEDFTAITLGGAWRRDHWSVTARAELRDGDSTNRRGLAFGAIRQLGEGRMLGAGFTFTRATDRGGATTKVFDSAVSLALRPADSAFAVLSKLELRSDVVRNARANASSAGNGTMLSVEGSARSTRAIGSLSANWTPGTVVTEDDGTRAQIQRSEVGVYAAVRHNFDRYEGFDLRGTTLIGGVEARLGIGERIEIGMVATVRHSLSGGSTSFAIGPQIGISPARNTMLTIGYNITGFRDRDFSAARSTERGVFVGMRMKFDAHTFGFLGLGR